MPDPRAEELLDFVRRNLLQGRRAAVTADSRLLTDGVIDSLGVTLVAAFVEERFGVRFDDTEIREGRLETVRQILAAVDRRR